MPFLSKSERLEKQLSINYLCHLWSWRLLVNMGNRLSYRVRALWQAPILPRALVHLFSLVHHQRLVPSQQSEHSELCCDCVFASCSRNQHCVSSGFYLRGLGLPLVFCSYSRTFWPILNEHQIYVWQIAQSLPKTRGFSVLVQNFCPGSEAIFSGSYLTQCDILLATRQSPCHWILPQTLSFSLFHLAGFIERGWV